MKKIKFLTVLTGFGLMVAGSAKAADFTIELPPLPFPPKILSVTSSGPQVGKSTTVTVRARGAKQRRLDLEADPPTNFCDEQVVPNPPLVLEGKVWYTTSLDDQRANWASVDLTPVATPTDDPGCDEEPKETELTGVIPSSILTGLTDQDKLVYYVQVVDSSGNRATYTPDANAGNLPETTTDLQTAPNLAAKPPKGSEQNLLPDVAGDTKGNIGQAVSVPSVDITGANVAIGTSHLTVNIKLSGKPANDGGVIEGYVGAFIRGDAVDDDPNDALYPDGTFALSTAFQGVLPDLVHAVWDGRCLTNVAVTGGSTEDLIACNLYAGGSGTGMLEKDGQGYINWRLEHSTNGVSLIGGDKGVEVVLATGQIDIAAPSGTPPFWITDYTNGVTYYQKTMEETVSTTQLPPPACGGMSVELVTGGTNTCKVKWKNSVELTGGSYFIFRSEKKDGGGSSGPNITILNSGSPVAQGTEGADNSYDDAGLTKDGKIYHYWCMPRDADGRIYAPTGNATIGALCTNAGCGTFPANWPANATVSCQTEDTVPPVAPVTALAETPAGAKLKIEVSWEPGTLANDPSMLGVGAGFVIERDTIPVATKPFVAGVTKFTYLDSGCTAIDEQHEYVIKAKDVGGNLSPALTVQGTCKDKEPPGLVPNLKGVNQTSQEDASGKVKLTWEPLGDDEKNDDFGEYVVYRCGSDSDPLGNCSDGSLPSDKANYTAISCPNMNVRGTEGNPPSCVDTTVSKQKYYHYVVTAKDDKSPSNEGGFPTSAFAESAYPYRWVRVETKPIVDTFAPDKVRGLTAADSELGGICSVSFQMPTKNAATPPDDLFCANGGQQGYCSGSDTDVIPNEVSEYVVIAGSSPPADKGATPCGLGTNPGTLSDSDALITVQCGGLTNGEAYKINVFAQDSKSPPNQGDFFATAADCTPTDKVAPALPSNGKGVAVKADQDFVVGWQAPAPEVGGGFKVYVCSAAAGANCTAFTKAHTETLVDTELCNVAEYPGLAGSNFCYLLDPEEPGNKVFYFRATAVDAAGNELAHSASNQIILDLSIPAAVPQSCLTEAAEAGDKVDCFWQAYADQGGIDNLILAVCKTAWDGEAALPTPDCGAENKWLEQVANVAKDATTVSVAAGTFDTGCYKFAVLAKSGDSKSSVLTAAKFPTDNTCLGVKKNAPPPPECDADCVKVKVEAVANAQGTLPDVKIEIINSSSNAVCLEGEAPVFKGDGIVKVAPGSCGDKVKIRACNIPAGWLRNKTDNCKVCKEVTLADVKDKDVMTTCTLASPAAGGDANGDNKVNIQDFGKLKGEFGKPAPQGGFTSDFNGDGKVDLKDFGLLKGNFNQDGS